MLLKVACGLAVRKSCDSHSDLYLGVDPGASGAVAVLVWSGGWTCLCADIPTTVVARKGGTKTEFNNTEIVDCFSLLSDVCGRLRCVVENVPPRIPGRGDNAYTGFRLGWAVGMWPLFLAGMGFSAELVAPITWKSAMGLRGRDKAASLQAARGLFPKADLSLKKHVDRAEAALLAEWLRRRCEGERP